MNRKMPYDQFLLAIVLALVGFGLIMVFSASALLSQDLYGSHTAIFSRQLIAVVLGLMALMVTMKIDYHYYEKRPVICVLLALALMLLVYVLISPGAGGARRWVRLGPVNFQPSELAKLAIIFFTSYCVVHRRRALRSWKEGLVPYLVVVSAILGLILLEPDLGTAASIAATASLLLLLAGLQLRYFAALAAAAVPAAIVLVLAAPYRVNRILAFLDPERDPYGIGYQIRQSLIAVGSGGWNGLGFAQGKQKLFFLPEPHTDFIFAVVGEELGTVGCLALLLLFAVFFWRGVRISLRADTPFGTFLGLGIVAMIVLQALVNMSVVLSLLPTKGLPLPFVSVGGSSMFVMLAGTGILLNISHWGTRGARNLSAWTDA